MSEILDIARDLKVELDNLSLFKEYKAVESLYLNSEELNELRKLIVRAKNENRLEDHQKLLNDFNHHPLVENYNSLKQEVIEYLQSVSKVIQEK